MLVEDADTKRSKECLHAIMNSAVVCFAPDILLVEFINNAFEFRSGRRPYSGTAEHIDLQLELFLQLPITYEPLFDLASAALHYMRRHKIPPPDSWYLAAAEANSAELWITRNQGDNFAVNARKVYDQVFTFEKQGFFARKIRKGR